VNSPIVSTGLGMPLPHISPVLLFLCIALPLSLLAGIWIFRKTASPSRGVIALAGAVLVFIGLALHFHYFPNGVDDSFISLRFSENFAQGQGFTFNPGVRIEGFSNPLWVLLMAGLSALGLNLSAGDWVLPLAAKLTSVLCHLIIFGMIIRWAAKSKASPYALLGGMAWLVAASVNTIWAVSGMETTLHSLLLVWLAVSWSDLAGKSSLPASPTSLTIAMLLLVLSRPEGAMFGVVMLALWWWQDRKSVGHTSLRWKTAAFSFIALIAAISVFRWIYFGDLLPNTFYAKATGSLLFRLRHGAQYLGLALLATGGWVWIAALWHDRDKDGFLRAAPQLLIAAQIAFILYAGGDWMQAWRFWATVVPLGVMGLIRFLNTRRVWIEAKLSPQNSRWLAPMSVAALLAGASLQAIAFDGILFMQNDYRVSGFRRLALFPSAAHYDAALEIRKVVKPGAVVAFAEAGLIPYETRAVTLDVHGLLDRGMAELPGLMHQKATGAAVLARKPDYILMEALPANPDTTTMELWRGYVKDLYYSKEFAEKYREIYRNSFFALFRRNHDMELDTNLQH
jgi:arabinofuranosyltransferase